MAYCVTKSWYLVNVRLSCTQHNIFSDPMTEKHDLSTCMFSFIWHLDMTKYVQNGALIEQIGCHKLKNVANITL